MTIEVSLQIKLLAAPTFSEYDGGNAFMFYEKIYQRCKMLGSGAYGEVYCFEADDQTKLAVKGEMLFHGGYGYGSLFQQEAKWCQKIYGLGILSGDPKNSTIPHYVLMPYFEGKTLANFYYGTLKDVFFSWIKTADSINQLHTQHHIVHGDLKSDNVVLGTCFNPLVSHDDREKAFVIDFGFATKIHAHRDIYIASTDENKKRYRQHAPELFGDADFHIASPTHDIYALGILLRSMYIMFLNQNEIIEDLVPEHQTLTEVKENLICEDPTKRWSIAKAIFMLITTFFSRISKPMWVNFSSGLSLEKMRGATLMQDLWKTSAGFAINMRKKELELEQGILARQGKKSNCKENKISGLTLLESEIRIQNASALETIVARTENKFPDLTAGVFSQRTKTLMDELSRVAPVFH